MLAGTTFQEVLVLFGVTRNISDTHKRSFFFFVSNNTQFLQLLWVNHSPLLKVLR